MQGEKEMIETKMPKDIRAYKTKLIGPFTGRQTICVAIAGVVFILFYACIAKPFHLPQEYLFYIGLPLIIPILAFGWYEPNGMKLEKYLQKVVIRSFAVPIKRKAGQALYKTEEKKPLTKEEQKNKKKANNKKGNNSSIKGYE